MSFAKFQKFPKMAKFDASYGHLWIPTVFLHEVFYSGGSNTKRIQILNGRAYIDRVRLNHQT